MPLLFPTDPALKHRNYNGSWRAREKPHLVRYANGDWFCTALDNNGYPWCAIMPTAKEAYDKVVGNCLKRYKL
jgi:hypothetical protein